MLNNHKTGKSIDEEKYILFPINREKADGESFRDGGMEVTFELWGEQLLLGRPVASNGDSHRYQGKQYRNRAAVLQEQPRPCAFPVLNECRNISEFRWYRGFVIRPERLLGAVFFTCWKLRRQAHAKNASKKRLCMHCLLSEAGPPAGKQALKKDIRRNPHGQKV